MVSQEFASLGVVKFEINGNVMNGDGCEFGEGATDEAASSEVVKFVDEVRKQKEKRHGDSQDIVASIEMIAKQSFRNSDVKVVSADVTSFAVGHKKCLAT